MKHPTARHARGMQAALLHLQLLLRQTMRSLQRSPGRLLSTDCVLMTPSMHCTTGNHHAGRCTQGMKANHPFLQCAPVVTIATQSDYCNHIPKHDQLPWIECGLTSTCSDRPTPNAAQMQHVWHRQPFHSSNAVAWTTTACSQIHVWMSCSQIHVWMSRGWKFTLLLKKLWER